MDDADVTYRDRLWTAARALIVGGAIGLLAFGLAFAAYSTIAGSQLGVDLDAEDGAFEWLGALAFLAAALFQAVLFWRSDVPKGQRLVPFMRRNVFYLGLAVLLFLGFGEEISWGQRIFGWATPADIVNAQGETNIHNLAPFQGESLLNVHRLFNLFWLTYCVLVPITAVAVSLLAALYRRISLPVPPLWIGGLFVGAFAAWRLYNVLQPADALAGGQELAEASMALCFAALGIAQLRSMRSAGESELSRTAPMRQPL